MKIGGYEFSEGARFQPGEHPEAPIVGAHLDMLRQKMKGELTPADVVADARNPNSPLHSFFEWDDSEAAEAYRLGQARGLIRAVVAVYVQESKPAVRHRMFVHVPEPGAPHYRETGHAMSQAKTRELVLQRAWAELQGWRARYKDLREFAELFTVIDEAIKALPKPAKR